LKRAAFCTVLALMVLAATSRAQSQSAFPEDQRSEMFSMLSDMRFQISEHYYDEKFHGLNLDERYAEYKEKIQNAHSTHEGLRLVAAFVAGLKDSHTYFAPPPLSDRADYGYKMEIIGDRCFIAQLRPGSDAAAKLHIGDEVLKLNGYSVNREDLWQLWYDMNDLEPVKASEFKLRLPDGQVADVVANSTQLHGQRLIDQRQGDFFNNGQLEAEQRRHELRQRDAEIGDVLIWKMPAFLVPDENELGRMIDKARRHTVLILDLRGNLGGSVDLLEKALGSFVPADAQVAQRVGRKPMKPIVARKWAGTFEGKLIVLVDSSSASGAEIFARTIQLHHRGIVVGDRTAGSVMESEATRLSKGSNFVLFYGISITVADLIMPDGQSLEHRGVTPDEVLLPTADDLAQGRDPVLAHAVEEAGGRIDSKAAGALFPFEWRPLSLSH
jgi:C-terminal processing protease CtpA/Prc